MGIAAIDSRRRRSGDPVSARTDLVWTWYTLTGLLVARIVADWPLPDNHVYLLMSWCLAVALALGAAEPGRN